MAFRICLFILFFSVGCYGQSLPSLIPYNDGGKWGYANIAGEVLIKPQWDGANFFANGKAIVMIFDRPAKETATWQLIDTQGNYIIGPEMHWTGVWGGWEKTWLNARDSNGRWGLIDTNGKVYIPMEWEQHYTRPCTIRDSFKIVQKNGLKGLIDRQNKLVLPCKYENIYDLFQIRAVSIVDTGKGDNKFGLATLEGKLILPPRYSRIALLWSESGKPLLKVSYIVNGKNRVPGTEVSRYLHYPSGRKATRPANERLAEQPRQTVGEYIAFGFDRAMGLMDKKQKVVIPCCSVKRVSRDTIYTEFETRISEDSLLLTTTLLHTSDLLPYGPSRETFLYKDPPYYSRRRGCQIDHYIPEDRESGYNKLPIEGRYNGYFYKDSFLFHTTWKPSGEKNYFVEANRQHGYRNYTYSAMVDVNRNYIAGPFKESAIATFCSKDSLFVVGASNSGYFEWGHMWGHLLMSMNGDILLKFPGIIYGYKHNGKIYAVVLEKEPDIIATRENKYSYKVIDGSGQPVKFFEKKLPYNNDPESMQSTLSRGKWITVNDSFGKAGYFYPDGSPAMPEFNFKYHSISGISKNIYHVRFPSQLNGARSGNAWYSKFIDAEEKELFPGLIIDNFRLADRNSNFSYESPKEIIPDLYRVAAHYPNAPQFTFYMNKDGIGYYCPPSGVDSNR